MEDEGVLLEGFDIPENFEIEEVKEDAPVEQITQPVDNSIDQEGIDEKAIVKEILEDNKTDLELPDNDEEEDNNQSDGSQDGELFKSLAEALKDNGLLSGVDSVDDITSIDKFTDAFRKEIKSSEFADLSETQKRVLSAFRSGVPSEDILQHENTQAQLMSIDEKALHDNEDLRKNIILTDLRSKGVSDARADKLYQAMYDSGEDIEEAKESLSAMQEVEREKYDAHINNLKKQKESAVEAKQQEFNKLKDNISSIDKFLGEIPVSEIMKENVQKAMSIPVDYLEDGTPINKLMKARMDDPITFETNLYYLFELTNGFEDLSVFSKRATSSAVKKLSKAIGNSTFVQGSGNPSYQDDPNSYNGSEIVEF